MRDSGRAIPKVVDSIDLKSLPLGSLEGFVLSRIDGRASLAELVDRLGLPQSTVEGALERLVSLGAIVMDDATEAVDLSPERCRFVRETFARLDRLSYYELLGIPDSAEKAEVRSAYFALSKLVHPDTMFGKRLGSFKPKMEAIFKQATEAYDTLSKRKRREAYDETLGLEPLAERMAKAPKARDEAEPPAAPEPPVGRTSSVQSRPPAPTEVARPNDAERGARGTPSVGSLPRAPERSPGDSVRTHAQERVLQQIAKMAGRSGALPARPTPSPSSFPPDVPSSGVQSTPRVSQASSPPSRPSGPPSSRESLLRDLASSLRDANRLTSPDRLDKHLRAARTAEQAGDLVGAANALRLAHEVCPDREEIAAEYRRLRAALAKAQAASFEKQATREERMELWGAAALSWSRVAEGRPDDASAHRRAAFCLWRSNGDLKRARDLALRAIELSSGDIEARITLGRIYLGAGMKLNARREIEAAAKLDPKDEIVKNLLRELKT